MYGSLGVVVGVACAVLVSECCCSVHDTIRSHTTNLLLSLCLTHHTHTHPHTHTHTTHSMYGSAAASCTVRYSQRVQCWLLAQRSGAELRYDTTAKGCCCQLFTSSKVPPHTKLTSIHRQTTALSCPTAHHQSHRLYDCFSSRAVPQHGWSCEARQVGEQLSSSSPPPPHVLPPSPLLLSSYRYVVRGCFSCGPSGGPASDISHPSANS